MSIIPICHCPNATFELPFYGLVTLDINQSIRTEMKEDKDLTNEVALRILSSIQLESDVKSFFSRPVGLLTLGALAFTGGLAVCITIMGFAFPLIAAIIGVASTTIGGGLIGISTTLLLFNENCFEDITRAYDDQSKLAATYIEKITVAQKGGKPVQVVLEECLPQSPSPYISQSTSLRKRAY